MSQWIIIYPRGNRSWLDVAEICFGMEYEISDYDVASRQRFYDEDEAIQYCKELAAEYGLRTNFINAYLD